MLAGVHRKPLSALPVTALHPLSMPHFAMIPIVQKLRHGQDGAGNWRVCGLSLCDTPGNSAAAHDTPRSSVCVVQVCALPQQLVARLASAVVHHSLRQ